MAFTTLKFIRFLCVASAGYFLLPKRARWIWLLLASGYFYACAGLRYVGYLLCSAMLCWSYGTYTARLTRMREAGERTQQEAAEKTGRAAALVIVLHIGGLIFLRGPGLSFFAFMAIGYCVDVCRGSVTPERNPLRLALFLGFFPHLMQGPIDRWDSLAPRLFEGHTFDFERFRRGLYRILWGFFEKLVVADRLAILVNGIFDAPERWSGLYLAGGVVCYAFQIYADFAGYMDIALGAAELFGIRLAENFDTPYYAESILEYWRRWHITLGGWFRDYLYYPLLRSRVVRRFSKRLSTRFGRKRAGTICTCLALLVVWLSTGLWHGFSGHYAAWGLYYGVLLVLSAVTAPGVERLVKKLRLERFPSFRKGLARGRTFGLVLIGYVFFRAESLGRAGEIFRRIIFCFPRGCNEGHLIELMGRKDLTAAFLGVAVIAFGDLLRSRGDPVGDYFDSLPAVVRWGFLYAAIAVVLLFGVYGPGYNAASFLYFQF